jgi:DNA-binding LacI/PurR family transcriptional regulator
MLSDPVTSSFIKGVASTLQTKSKRVMLCDGTTEKIKNVIDFVDGVICYGELNRPDFLEQLLKLNKPVVAVDFIKKGAGTVIIDNYKAAFELAQKIIRKEDIVAVLGIRLLPTSTTCRLHEMLKTQNNHSIYDYRLAGYKDALSELDIELDPFLVWNIPSNQYHYALQAVVEVLSISPCSALIKQDTSIMEYNLIIGV